MKKQLQKILLLGGITLIASANTQAQTTSTFESLTLPGTFWNGSAQPLGTTFTDGNTIFPNHYDTSYGGYWSSGWSYSNVKDSTTAGFGNMYAARPGSGYAGSKNYIVGQQNAIIKLSDSAIGKVVNGLYVTNSTYAALSMRDGDGFSKKFGGTSGNDTDWFKLTVRKYSGGVMTNDSVEFYLADYRFADNTKDYIVTNWQWVDLTSLGNVDSLKFILSSSDVGAYGMNTPAFFCMDNFTTQTTSTFESLVLTYWNGSAQPLGTTFTDGNAIFQNYYDTAWGGLWTQGWAYSNVKDSTTAGFGNMYAARPGSGYSGSKNYVVGQQNSIIKLSGAALEKAVNGFYVTNSTYAALSMRDGDGFSKKFGGTSGNDADWFKLTIRKYSGGVMTNDSVEFYLADYRFTDNSKDYIVTTWQLVDLTSLGNVDSLKFILSSSDVGTYGMNTPSFFCMDNFTTADSLSVLAVTKIDNKNLSVSVFPNPCSSYINVNFGDSKLQEAVISIIDVTGKLLYSEITHTASSQISVAHLPEGMYYLKITGDNYTETKAFIKQ